MNHLALRKYAQQRALEYEQGAARQTLARLYHTSSPTYHLERTFYLATALFWFATALPVGVWVLFMQSRGFTLGQVGVFFGLYSLTVALLEVPSGVFADRWGRRRCVLISIAFLMVAQLALLWAFSPALLLLWAVLYGAGRALVSGALEAWFMDRVKEAAPGTDLQPLFARAGTAELLALTLGTLLGGALPELFAGLPEDAVLSPLSVALVASVGVKVVLVGVVWRGVREARTERSVHTSVRGLVSSSFALSRQNPALRLLFLGSLLGGFAGAGLETFWQPRFAELLGPQTLLLSAILAGSFGAGMFGNLAAVPLARLLRGRHARLAALAQGLAGLGLIVLAWQTQALPAVLLFWLVYLARSVAGSPAQALLNEQVPGAARAALLSVGSLMTYVGFSSGSAVLGRVAEQTSVGAAWWVAGVALVLSGVVYGRLGQVVGPKRVAREPRPAPEAAAGVGGTRP